MKNKKLIIILIILVGGFILARVLKNSNTPVNAREVKVETLVVSKTVSASGVVISENYAEMSFPITGTVTNINTAAGDDVKKGSLLGDIYNYDLQQSAQSYKDARDVALRDKELFIEQYVTNKDALGGTDEYNIQLRRKEELLSKAEAAYQASLGSFSKTFLYAPFDGTIIDIKIKVGEVAVVGTPAIIIADLDKPAFEIEVDQEDFGLISLNQEVNVKLEAYENIKFKGNITKMPLYSAIEDSEGTDFIVKIQLEQAENRPILYGMNGDVKIVIDTTQKEVNSLPFDSIFTNGASKPFVWVEEEGKLVRKEITIGLEGDLFTEVLNDLGDKVLVPADDKTEFSEGEKVRITN